MKWTRLEDQAILEFSGPDAVRYLNGQLTQDVRLVENQPIALPSCVTDAKGRLQFRVMIMSAPGGSLWVTGPLERADELEARLTRYLIADDVEVANRSGGFVLVHFLAEFQPEKNGAWVRAADRFGVKGTDAWFPVDGGLSVPDQSEEMDEDALEALRISRGIPRWGAELEEGMLPPEALLDLTDVSYHKGCYIGQEVISRIKSAGKVNRRLTRFLIAPSTAAETGALVTPDGGIAGSLTSISPQPHPDGSRDALGFVKRGVEEVCLPSGGGISQKVE